MIEEQTEIPLKRDEVELALIRQQPTEGAAINLSISISGLVPKQICSALNIDKATLSKVISDQAAFCMKKLDLLANVTGNEVPMTWWIDRRGYKLEPKESKWERLLREEQEARRIAERDKEYLEQLLIKRG